MNEVEKHYSGEAVGASGSHGAGSEPKGTLDQVAATAKEGLKSATDAARSAAETARSAAGAARDTASQAYDQATRSVSEARRRSAQHITRGRRGVEALVEENPVMIGVAGLAAGLLLGALLPSTRRENQVFGRYADEVRDQGLRYARDLAHQGRQFVEENLDAVAQAARTETGARPQG
jgi:ElaB/YqjD/DUF883 family membrane-anchored ribosome-binding protein